MKWGEKKQEKSFSKDKGFENNASTCANVESCPGVADESIFKVYFMILREKNQSPS